MIQNSFIILNSINNKKEKELWEFGCTDWNNFLSSQKQLTKNHELHKSQILDAKNALTNLDQTHFTTLLPPSEHWRLYNNFKDEAAFLDIETTSFKGNTTVVGIYDNNKTHILIKNKNLNHENLKNILSNYKMIITFNGACFDLPILTREFDIDFSNHLHIDLRFVCSKIDLKGGLKNIEKEIGINRDDDIKDIDGKEAVRLWKRYEKTNDENYLNLLIKYNIEDIINLKALANNTIPRLWEKTFN